MIRTIPLVPEHLREVHDFYRRVRGGPAAPRLRPCETVSEFETWLTSGPWGLAGDVARNGANVVGLATLTQFVPWRPYATTAELTIAYDSDITPTRHWDVVEDLVARAVNRAAGARLHCLSTFLVDEETTLRDCLIENGFSQAGELTLPAGASSAAATARHVGWLWLILATDEARPAGATTVADQ